MPMCAVTYLDVAASFAYLSNVDDYPRSPCWINHFNTLERVPILRHGGFNLREYGQLGTRKPMVVVVEDNVVVNVPIKGYLKGEKDEKGQNNCR